MVVIPSHANDWFLLENKGQWNESVLFRAEIPAGRFYIDHQGFTYQLYEGDKLAAMHSDDAAFQFSDIGIHTIKTRFVNALPPSKIHTSEPSDFHTNFFLGNDSSNWAGHVKSYSWMERQELYAGIDLHVYRKHPNLKYDLIVHPGSDPNQIKLDYTGADSLVLQSGDLQVYYPYGHFTEHAPFVYQLHNGRIQRVVCHYVLDGETLSFVFPEGYDSDLKLIIDPEISFSSYVGSSQSSFGFTATYDEEGHLYAGAIAFGSGYPITAGAYDATHGGGNIDIGITKFTPDGTNLVYSTFLGGNRNESPHSLVVNDNNELYVLGHTGSNNFPTTSNAYQTNFAGGSSLTFNYVGYGFSHSHGSDIFIARFSADGSDLLSATLLGGSGNDGLNTNAALEYNYGDAFRGEIIVDEVSNVYVASVTSSTDFPTTAGAFQTSYGGGTTDGCLFKMSPDLGSLIWSSYLGGTGADAAFSLQRNDVGSIYAVGITASTNLQTTPNALHPSNQGDVDGFVAKIAANGQTTESLTYIGTSGFDEVFFVQLDTEQNPFIVGVTTGNYPVSDGVYTNPNSGQFIQKLSPDLSFSLMSTVVGNGNGGPNISVSAFLVSNCDQIYISGWGGGPNVSLAGIITSTTTGLPITDDAFQSNTDGKDFYLMVLGPEASELVYATYFGGTSSEHVDGGTSRFDKKGTVYQALCAGCGGNNDFPTQTGVWSEVNPSALANGQCNLGVFKFDLTKITAEIDVDGPSEVCVGSAVSFINNTTVANQFFWDFSGLGTSTESEPEFTFTEPGEYTITLIASHEDDCIHPDSTSMVISVTPPPELEISASQWICAGDSVELFVSGGNDYLWSPAGQISDPTSNNPTVWCDETTTFIVTLTAQCGSVTDTVTVFVYEEDFGTGDDQSVCPGETVAISAYGGITYNWTPTASLNNPTSATPLASPDESTTYSVEISSPNNCKYTETVQVTVLDPPPTVTTSEVAAICEGASVVIWANGNGTFLWDPIPGLNHYDIPNPLASPPINTWYYVNVTNECGTTRDSVLVNVGVVNPNVQTPDTICPNQPTTLHASGGITYQWHPLWNIENSNTPNPTVFPQYTTEYSVTVTDEYGCSGMASVVVPVYPAPYVFADPDEIVDYYDYVSVGASSNGTLSWSSDLPLSCTDCPSPVVHAIESGAVYVLATDENGCTATDSLMIAVTGALYVPNAFSPNGDGVNDLFKAVGSEIEEFHLQIFDRWGELIFESFDINQGWDGGVNQHYVESEVYVWHIVAKEHTGVHFEMRGHVTVVR